MLIFMLPLFVEIIIDFFLCGDCCHNDMVMVPKVPGVFQYRPSSDDAIPFLRPCTK